MLSQQPKSSLLDADALVKAAYDGNYNEVVSLLDKKVEIDYISPDGSTALQEAVLHDHQEIVKLLLDKKADINYANRFGVTALMLAVRKHNIRMVELLLEYVPLITKQDQSGSTALLEAVDLKIINLLKTNLLKKQRLKPEQEEIIKLFFSESVYIPKELVELINLYHEPDQSPEQIGDIEASSEMELIRFVFTDKKNKVEQILKKEVVLLDYVYMNSTFNIMGQTALTIAASKGNLGMVTVLLDHKASVDHPNKDGDSPLIISIKSGHQKVAELLLDKKADIHFKGKNGQTPLHIAESNLSMKNLLLQHIAKPLHSNISASGSPTPPHPSSGDKGGIDTLISATSGQSDKKATVTPLFNLTTFSSHYQTSLKKGIFEGFFNRSNLQIDNNQDMYVTIMNHALKSGLFGPNRTCQVLIEMGVLTLDSKRKLFLPNR